MSDPDYRHICPVPPTEWSEGREINFNTLQERVYRRARFFVDAEAFEDGDGEQRVAVRFLIDCAALNGKSDAELAELMASRTLSAVREARHTYSDWQSRRKRGKKLATD